MSTYRISVRIPEALQKRLTVLAQQTGQSESDITRMALEEYCKQQSPRETAYDAFLRAGLIGDGIGLPPDLSTNPKYMEGFGRD